MVKLHWLLKKLKNPEDAIGLMHWKIGDWNPTDIEVVAAFDIDECHLKEQIGKVHRCKEYTLCCEKEDSPDQ